MWRACRYTNVALYQGIRATWSADFLLGDIGGLTLSRATTGTYFDAAGVLQTAAIDAARFDHVIGTGDARGLLMEESRTDVILWNRDLTNAAWVATNITAAKNQTGIDGVGNSASSITATAANATILQSITLASSARFQSAYVKRLVGSGVVQMTMDGGLTWTAVSPTASWSRVSIPAQTIANPQVGFRLVASGDSIAVDFVRNENGTFATSPTEQTTVAVTRSADMLPLSGTALTTWNASAMSAVVELSILANQTFELAGSNSVVGSLQLQNRSPASGNDVRFNRSGTEVGTTVAGSIPASTAARIGVSRSGLLVAGAKNGVTSTGAFSASPATANDVRLFLTGSGHLRKAALYSAYSPSLIATKTALGAPL